jgi:hypothetical protein
MNNSFCKKMKWKIIAVFMQHIYTTPEFFSEKAQAKPTKGKSVDEATTCLIKAINMMVFFCFSQIFLTYIRDVYLSNMKYVHFNRR